VKRILQRILVVLLALGLGAAYVTFLLPNTFQGDRFINVSKGETFHQVEAMLDTAGILRSKFFFEVAGRTLDLTTRMQIGKYRFRSGMSNTEILEDLRSGKTIEAITLTIPEGARATRQARILARHLGIDSSKFMSLVYDTSFARSLGIASSSFEGYLMPNTYKFFWQEDESEIIKTMVGEFWRVLDDSLEQSVTYGGRTIHEILTLASIVEMETSIDSERAVIAGVYLNRLKKNMRLEADPTIQYILEDGPRRLYYTDLQKESEYNTYLHRGLPPGPINNPGKASIYAAIFPAKNKYMFFVASGGGGHTFSKTYEEHMKAVRRLRKLRAVREVEKQEG
jgi:UPF0755 protein